MFIIFADYGRNDVARAGLHQRAHDGVLDEPTSQLVYSYLSSALKKRAETLDASGIGLELQADGVPIDVSLK